jgi:transposase
MKNTLYLGCDVHAETINFAGAEPGRDGSIEPLGIVTNREDAIRKKIRKLQAKYKRIEACYEAGPCGYTLYWQLLSMGVSCEVIAPTLIPKKAGDKVKTDRRDAMKLARSYRSGDLTPVWVPDPAHEALRDLVRARTAAKKDERTARHRLSKFILRRGIQKPAGMKNWTHQHMRWLKSVEFTEPSHAYVFVNYCSEVDHHGERIKAIEKAIDAAIERSPETIREVVAALQLMRGVAKTTAIGIVTEVGNFSRFTHPTQLMAYAGVVPSEYSTGGPGKKKQGGITKTGNSHLRRLITEAGWNYRFKPFANDRMKKSQENLQAELVPTVKGIAWKAQHRLCGRYRALLASGKSKQLTVTAVGREMLGFIWAIATYVEGQHCTLNNVR